MAYSDKVIDHYENPRNVGKFDEADDSVGTGMVGAPACGDVMRLQIQVNDDGVIVGTGVLNGEVRAYAMIPVAGGCNDADLAEPFGVTDLADIQCFIFSFTNGLELADFAAPFGVLDLADIQAFVQAFVNGCP